MRCLAALLLFATSTLWAQNPNNLPPCPKPDYAKNQDIGWSGRTWHWNDCWGRYVFQLSEELNGTRFEGEWRYGQLTGTGNYAKPDGEKYIGQFRKFLRHGHGQITYSNADQYVGDFDTDIRHGHGIYTFANGDRYEGDFRNGKADGQGGYTFAGGDRYTGEFLNDEFHGQGTYLFASGGKYVGEYRLSKRHGAGTTFLANGDKYVGEYKDGDWDGQGSYYFASGDKYIGEFKDGKFHGQGIFTAANGRKTDGLWENDKFISEARSDADDADSDSEQALEREREQLAEERRQLEEDRRNFDIARGRQAPAPVGKDEEKPIVSGSGFVITPDGYVVTNYHVIEGTKELMVRTTNGKTYHASIATLDAKNDLAVLKIEAAGLAHVPVIDSSTVKRGTTVLAGGFPQIVVQGIEPKVTDGMISALTGIKDDPTTFQISNPVQPGNSGGPLFTLDGNVIGIVSAQLSEQIMQREFDSIPQNVNFAVKSNYLLQLLAGLRAVRLPSPNPKRRFRTTEDVVGAVEPALVLIMGQ